MDQLPIALYRAAQVRELDRIAIQERGIPGYTLMSRAGEAAFQLLRQRWPDAQHLTIICGGGNNGGDGYVVARLARQAGLAAHILTLADPQTLSGDAQIAWQDALSAEVAIAPFAREGLEGADLLIDAILGTGLERPITGAWREAIDAINAHPADTLALDIPSGLHADTGAILVLNRVYSPDKARPVVVRSILPISTPRRTSTRRCIRPVGAIPVLIFRRACPGVRAAPTKVILAMS